MESITEAFSRPLTVLKYAIIMAGLFSLFIFFASAAYHELRHGMDFRTFCRRHSREIPFVFGLLAFALTALGFWLLPV